jgi:hypothetical protein
MPCAANDSGEWRRYTSDFGLKSLMEGVQGMKDLSPPQE